MNELGTFIRELRGKRSLREIADSAGISHTYLRDLEKGIRRGTKTPVKPSPETLKGIAKALGVDYKEIMIKAGYLNDDEFDSEHKQQPDRVDEFLNKIIDLSDDEIIDSIKFTYKGEPVSKEKMRAILNLLRLDAKEKTD